jgi:hypothetical protein
MTKEEQRIKETSERRVHWRRWGPYLSERAWGTVREDYSPYGTAWDYLPHDHARSKAYRWGEDGLAGICDNHQGLCFALALWNGRDPFLKERLFGLTGSEGNHGEDCKEYYFYLDSTPTHSYMRWLYKYPQKEFPYHELVEENRRRNKRNPEYELVDTGIFAEDRYFDVFVDYAKATTDDILIRISVVNRGPEAAVLQVLPTLWFRNTWSWDHRSQRPRLWEGTPITGCSVIEVDHLTLGRRWLLGAGKPELLFTENETNFPRLYGTPNPTPYVKDGVDAYVVQGKKEAVNPQHVGTKAAAHYRLALAAAETATLRLRLTDVDPKALIMSEGEPLGKSFATVFWQRQQEADEFYTRIASAGLSADARSVQRQAFAGLLWSKQWYHYDVQRWLEGDPAHPPPPETRKGGRNHQWTHFYTDDVLSMPDKWEYPWFAAWDLAFHCVPLALIDPDFAKRQLRLLLREWYMHPNGQVPAYEWAFGDVNPPVHAWAALRVYKIEKKMYGYADRDFLERVFHKLLLNFTWWVNRKDAEGKNVFQGGFLGLDNIGVFDRSAPLPTGGHIEQADGTSWMAMYCLNMLAVAFELADGNPAYEDVASKFFEHFVYIAYTMNHIGGENIALWDEPDGFYYDVLRLPDGCRYPLKVRSMVGLIPLFASLTLEPRIVNKLPRFKSRMEWFINNRPHLHEHMESMEVPGQGVRRLLSIVNRERLRRVLKIMLSEEEFLSPYGIRSLSRFHRDHPYILSVNGTQHRVDYEPAESTTALFGGNSNWRGPVWFPLNYLIIESLQKFEYYYKDSFKVECPSGSGQVMDLWEIATELSRRLSRPFLRGPEGRRPVHGSREKFHHDPHWRDWVLFYEYFHGDNGAGIGASHQTGWSSLVAKLLQQSGE